MQLATVRKQLLEVQEGYEKIQNELRETKLNSDDLLCQKEKELEMLKADIAKYQVSLLSCIIVFRVSMHYSYFPVAAFKFMDAWGAN